MKESHMREGELHSEFGSKYNTRWPGVNCPAPKLYDCDGNEMPKKCKCGKDGMLLVGKDSFGFVCIECMEKNNV